MILKGPENIINTIMMYGDMGCHLMKPCKLISGVFILKIYFLEILKIH